MLLCLFHSREHKGGRRSVVGDRGAVNVHENLERKQDKSLSICLHYLTFSLPCVPPHVRPTLTLALSSHLVTHLELLTNLSLRSGQVRVTDQVDVMLSTRGGRTVAGVCAGAPDVERVKVWRSRRAHGGATGTLGVSWQWSVMVKSSVENIAAIWLDVSKVKKYKVTFIIWYV